MTTTTETTCECNGGNPCDCPDCDHADCSYKRHIIDDHIFVESIATANVCGLCGAHREWHDVMSDDELEAQYEAALGDPMVHTCHTADGVEVRLGLRVRDYDNRIGVVVEAPRDYELIDDVCWPCAGHNGHWWTVCSDREGHVHEVGTCNGAQFDGSRMTTRGVAQ